MPNISFCLVVCVYYYGVCTESFTLFICAHWQNVMQWASNASSKRSQMSPEQVRMLRQMYIMNGGTDVAFLRNLQAMEMQLTSSGTQTTFTFHSFLLKDTGIDMDMGIHKRSNTDIDTDTDIDIDIDI